ncbi:tetratricopeptide repeat protein [Amylibacter sp.]|nr:tetratricopeptide repeat protein [Amylibacter sp.]
MEKISVTKILSIAKSLEKNGDFAKAKNLYQVALKTFPNNKSLRQNLSALKKNKHSIIKQGPSQEIINQLIYKYDHGQFKLAIEQASALIKLYPEAIIVWNILGTSQNSLGKVLEASQTFKRLTELHPSHADGFNNLGVTLQVQGNLDEAIEAYNKALSLKPDSAHAYYNMGNVLKEQGKLDKAIEAYNMTLLLNSNNPEAHNNMGIALKDLGKLDQAIEAHNKALSIKPDYAETYNNMGNALQCQGKPEEATDAYNNALSLKPDYAEAHNNKGTALKDLGKLDQAIEAHNKALSIKPDYLEAHFGIGNALTDLGKLDEAIEAYNITLDLNPNYADAFNNKGIALQDQGKTDKAIENYSRALTIEPDHNDAGWNQSLALLSKGDFKNGWLQYEKRWERSKSTKIPLKSSKSRWEPNKQGRVLVWSEQGLGDLIMFSSIIPDMYAQSKKLIIKTDARLIPIFKRSFPSDIKYYRIEEKVTEEQYDFQIPIGSLPLYFRTNLLNFKKNNAPYLKPDNRKVEDLRAKLISASYNNLVGISWHSTNQLRGAQNRAISLNQLAPILQLPKTKFINLQYGDVKKDINNLFTNYGIKIHQVSEIDNMKDIDGLASLIAACDSIISIDNSTIHLAGALGKKSKLLLPFSCDWRWGRGSNTSYWYNSVELYHQSEIGNWDQVLREL